MIDAGDSFQLLRRNLPAPAKYRAVYEVGKNIFLLHKGTESVVFLSHVPSSFFFLNCESERAKYAPANAVYGCLFHGIF